MSISSRSWQAVGLAAAALDFVAFLAREVAHFRVVVLLMVGSLAAPRASPAPGLAACHGLDSGPACAQFLCFANLLHVKP